MIEISEKIDFSSIGNILYCTRCTKPGIELENYVILYNGRVPLAILCNDCYQTMTQTGQLDEDKGFAILYVKKDESKLIPRWRR